MEEWLLVYKKAFFTVEIIFYAKIKKTGEKRKCSIMRCVIEKPKNLKKFAIRELKNFVDYSMYFLSVKFKKVKIREEWQIINDPDEEDFINYSSDVGT